MDNAKCCFSHADTLDDLVHTAIAVGPSAPARMAQIEITITSTNKCSRFTSDRPHVEATNNRAEQAIRPSVVNRKVWGGNRTDTGAQHQSILMSVLLTGEQLLHNPLDFLAQARRAEQPIPLFAPTR